MGRWSLALWFAACRPGEGSTIEPPTGSTGPDSTAPSTTDSTPGTSTGECAVDPELEVTAVTARPGSPDTLLQVDVTLSRPASAAVQCTSDDDPAEVFFAEDLAATEVHSLRLSGLIPRTSWRCSAAPTCPRMAAGAAPFNHQTAESPSDLRQLAVEVDPDVGMQGAWTVAPYALSAFFATTWIVVWGPDGRPRWWWETPSGVGVWIEARFDPVAHDLVWGGGFAPEGRIRSVDLWDGETYAWSPPDWQDTMYHHDGKRIADGRLMTLEIRPNHLGGSDWDGFGLRLHDPASGEVSFDFDSQTLVDRGLLPAGGGFESDPYHANWMDWQDGPDGPTAYVSLCFARQILAIDEATGDLRWQLGAGLGWTLLDADGSPLDDEALPQCQHGLEVDGDEILVYDNGQDRQQSSAVAWQVDGATHTATRVWSWTEPDWSEPYLGDVDYLPNGRVLVTEAKTFGAAAIVDLDRATGQVGSRLTFDEGGYTYRAERYDGCDLFTSVSACAPLAARYAEVESLLAP